MNIACRHPRMIGNAPTIKDITLELRELVYPANVLCNEELEEDVVEGAVGRANNDAYQVVTQCYICRQNLRLAIATDRESLRTLHSLLSENLWLLCAPCSRNGRFR